MNALSRLAQDYGLHHAASGTLEPHAPALTGTRRWNVDGIVRGLLPDDTAAALAVLRPPPRRVTADEAGQTPICAFVSEIPESAEKLPWLTCRSR